MCYSLDVVLGQVYFVFFFFQAEDGIRDVAVTGVQTCALPICTGPARRRRVVAGRGRCAAVAAAGRGDRDVEIGRASCRERGEISVVAVSLKKKKIYVKAQTWMIDCSRGSEYVRVQCKSKR